MGMSGSGSSSREIMIFEKRGEGLVFVQLLLLLLLSMLIELRIELILRLIGRVVWWLMLVIVREATSFVSR